VQRGFALTRSQIVAMEQRREDPRGLREQIGTKQKGPPDLERLKFEETALYRARKVKMAAQVRGVKEAPRAFGGRSPFFGGLSAGLVLGPLLTACMIM